MIELDIQKVYVSRVLGKFRLEKLATKVSEI